MSILTAGYVLGEVYRILVDPLIPGYQGRRVERFCRIIKQEGSKRIELNEELDKE